MNPYKDRLDMGYEGPGNTTTPVTQGGGGGVNLLAEVPSIFILVSCHI